MHCEKMELPEAAAQAKLALLDVQLFDVNAYSRAHESRSRVPLLGNAPL